MIRPYLRYFEVSGRSTRAEYWQFLGFQAVVTFGLFAFWVGIVLISPPGSMMIPSIGLGIGYVLFLLASIVPNVTVIIRRLHDSNRSGWWLCLYLPGVIATLQTLILVVRGLEATPEQMSAMVSQTINGTFLGMATTICQLTMFVYMVLPGTAEANRFGEAAIAPVPAPAEPEIAKDDAIEAQAEPVATRRVSLSNLPLQPVKPKYRPVPAVARTVVKSFETGPYNPGVKPAQPFGRRGAL